MPTVKNQKTLAAAFTDTTGALVNVTGFSFDVLAADRYHFQWVLPYQTAATTTGIRLSVTTPTVTLLSAHVRIGGFAADGAAAVWEGAITASADAVVSTDVVAATTNYIATVEGIVVPSAAGTVQLQFGSEVGSSAATIAAGAVQRVWQL